MVSINYATREITCKIVYYGPGLSGKTTNLIYVHKKVPATTKGKMISLATEADRTLYFDFLPINIGQINGFSAKFQLYTVPGQVYYNATRKLVLRGADGLVFVADSQADKMDENIESLTNLQENLVEYGYDIDELPIVIQYNKRDLPGALPVPELEAKLNPKKWPCFEGEAVNGRGVFDTLKMIIKVVLEKAKNTKSGTSAEKKAAPETPPETPVAETPPPAEPSAEPPVAPAAEAPAPSVGEPAATPPEQPPAEAPGPDLVRQPAYDAETGQSSEEETDDFDEVGIEHRDINDIDDSERPSVKGEAPKDIATPEPVTARAPAARPFPGSSTARVKRERRITVSDFQPAAREKEESPLQKSYAKEHTEQTAADPNMPSPTMAPSNRLVRKKRGFFKRLFGIK